MLQQQLRQWLVFQGVLRHHRETQTHQDQADSIGHAQPLNENPHQAGDKDQPDDDFQYREDHVSEFYGSTSGWIRLFPVL